MSQMVAEITMDQMLPQIIMNTMLPKVRKVVEKIWDKSNNHEKSSENTSRDNPGKAKVDKKRVSQNAVK